MSVETILASKGREVVTIDPDTTLANAVRILDERRIGAAVVVDQSGAVLGIFSERDMVRAVAERQAAALDEPVSLRMTREIVTCSSSSPVDEIMGIMTTGKFRHVPVVEAGKLGGIVSIGDIVKHRIAEVEAEHKAMRDYITTA